MSLYFFIIYNQMIKIFIYENTFIEGFISFFLEIQTRFSVAIVFRLKRIPCVKYSVFYLFIFLLT